MDKGKSAEKFENWQDRIIIQSNVPLIAEKSLCLILCNSFSFDWIFPKLADKVDKDKILNKFDNWADQIIDLRVTFP